MRSETPVPTITTLMFPEEVTAEPSCPIDSSGPITEPESATSPVLSSHTVHTVYFECIAALTFLLPTVSPAGFVTQIEHPSDRNSLPSLQRESNGQNRRSSPPNTLNAQLPSHVTPVGSTQYYNLVNRPLFEPSVLALLVVGSPVLIACRRRARPARPALAPRSWLKMNYRKEGTSVSGAITRREKRRGRWR